MNKNKITLCTGWIIILVLAIYPYLYKTFDLFSLPSLLFYILSVLASILIIKSKEQDKIDCYYYLKISIAMMLINVISVTLYVLKNNDFLYTILYSLILPIGVSSIIFLIQFFKSKTVIKKKWPWIVGIIIGSLPILFTLYNSIISITQGFCFIDCTTSIYGLEAFINTFIIIGILLFPFILFGLIIVIISTIQLRKIKTDKKTNKKRK